MNYLFNLKHFLENICAHILRPQYVDGMLSVKKYCLDTVPQV